MDMFDENGKVINYTFSGKSVCKSFYRTVTGLRRQLFDEVVNEVIEGTICDETASPAVIRTRLSRKEATLIACLDSIFKDKRNTKSDPTSGKNIYHVRSTWQLIYELHYCKMVDPSDLLGYKHFVKMRQEHRPNYLKSPRMSKGVDVSN